MNKKIINSIFITFLIFLIAAPFAVHFVAGHYKYKWEALNDEADKYNSKLSHIRLHKALQQQLPRKHLNNQPFLKGHKAPIDVSRYGEYEIKYIELRKQADYYYKIYNKISDNNIGYASYIIIFPYLFFMVSFFISQIRNECPTAYTYGFGLSSFACIAIFIKELISPVNCNGFDCIGIFLIPVYMIVLGIIIIILTHIYFRISSKTKIDHRRND